LEDRKTDHHSADRSSKGTVILIHGLNTKASALADLGQLAKDYSYDTVTIALAGHDISNGPAATLLHEEWVTQIKRAVQDVDHSVPKYVIGYSLGGAVALSYLAQNQTPADIKGLLLLAGANSLRIPLVLQSLLGSLPIYFSIRSFTPKVYRVHDRLTSKYYQSLFLLNQTIDYSRIDCRVIYVADPKDELISLSRMSRLVKNRNLKNWKIIERALKELLSTPTP